MTDAYEDVRPDESDRYAIIVLAPCSVCGGRPHETRRLTGRAGFIVGCLDCRGTGRERRRLAYTSRDGIGLCLVTLREDEELHPNDRVGVYDRLDRTWLVNPYGAPRPAASTTTEREG